MRTEWKQVCGKGRWTAALAAALMALGTGPVMAADAPSPTPTPPMPEYDYAAHCNWLAASSGTLDQEALKACYDEEIAAHNELSPDWGELSEDIRTACREKAEFVLRPSYATLRDCVEEMTGE